jgi:hypothetical protein
MRKASLVPLLFISILIPTGQNISAEEEKQPTVIFLRRSAIWSGEFTNFVNQEEGVIQRGRIRMKAVVDSRGAIKQSIAIIRPDGKASDYQGAASLRIEGNRLKWVGKITEDENTGNPIENHTFEGYLGWNQVYLVETYEEVFPDGRREKRKNNSHYVVLAEKKVLWLADIHVDGKLLVFANTVLELQD